MGAGSCVCSRGMVIGTCCGFSSIIVLMPPSVLTLITLVGSNRISQYLQFCFALWGAIALTVCPAKLPHLFLAPSLCRFLIPTPAKF